MTEYRLLTIWRIEAPLENVYAAIHNSPRWPDWWPGMQKVEEVAPGDAEGIGSILRYVWQGRLPYQVVFEVCATHIETGVAIEGAVRGDLEGVGHWHFLQDGEVCVIHHAWHVRTTRWWMNLIAPFARPMFIRNHGSLMRQGVAGLARLVGAPWASQENIDLMAEPAPPAAAPARIDPGAETSRERSV